MNSIKVYKCSLIITREKHYSLVWYIPTYNKYTCCKLRKKLTSLELFVYLTCNMYFVSFLILHCKKKTEMSQCVDFNATQLKVERFFEKLNKL